MPVVRCVHFTLKDNKGYCKLVNDICGHQKYCRADNKFKLNDTAYNCTILKKSKEVNKDE